LDSNFVETSIILKAKEALNKLFNSLDNSIEHELFLKHFILSRFSNFFNKEEQISLNFLKSKELSALLNKINSEEAHNHNNQDYKKPSDVLFVPGVYAFTCKETGKMYIGSSMNLFGRELAHK
jgi:hypothetical protein